MADDERRAGNGSSRQAKRPVSGRVIGGCVDVACSPDRGGARDRGRALHRPNGHERGPHVPAPELKTAPASPYGRVVRGQGKPGEDTTCSSRPVPPTATGRRVPYVRESREPGAGVCEGAGRSRVNPCSRCRKRLVAVGAARTRPLVAGRHPTRHGPSGHTTASTLTSLLTALAQPVPRVRNLGEPHAYDLLGQRMYSSDEKRTTPRQ